MERDELDQETAVFGPAQTDRIAGLAAALHVNHSTAWRYFNGGRISTGRAKEIRRVCTEERMRCRGPVDPVACLQDRRILVVEDEILLAIDVRDTLREFGAVVVGPAPSVATARPLLDAPLDAAVLDVRLGAELVTPIALILAERGVPIVFATANRDALGSMPAGLHGRPIVSKPYRPEDLAAVLGLALTIA